MESEILKVKGSYRDPQNHVYRSQNRVFRGLKRDDAQFIETFLTSDFYKQKKDFEIVDSWVINKKELETLGLDPHIIDTYDLWLEHKRLEFITYPYEWSFKQFQKAAIFHLNLQLDALEAGFQLKDASAFNVQFIGNEPIFIDLPSFKHYEEGQPWVAYKQFCEMFLAPLLINSYVGIDAQRWFKSDLNGINISDCSRILPWKTFFNLGVLGHIHMQARAATKITSASKSLSSKKVTIKKAHLVSLLHSMVNLLSSLKTNSTSYWQEYENNTSYSDGLAQEKANIIQSFAEKATGHRILDIGCNAGQFSEILLNSGAKEVIGIDIDNGALDKAIQRPSLKGKNFSALLYDFTNPSPALGWQLEERDTLLKRLPSCDGLICLALVHHLVIGKNIPLESFIEMMVSLAPVGIVEFPTKEDPMVKGLLKHREDIFEGYTSENFEKNLSKRCKVARLKSKNKTRHFFHFERI